MIADFKRWCAYLCDDSNLVRQMQEKTSLAEAGSKVVLEARSFCLRPGMTRLQYRINLLL